MSAAAALNADIIVGAADQFRLAMEALACARCHFEADEFVPTVATNRVVRIAHARNQLMRYAKQGYDFWV